MTAKVEQPDAKGQRCEEHKASKAIHFSTFIHGLVAE